VAISNPLVTRSLQLSTTRETYDVQCVPFGEYKLSTAAPGFQVDDRSLRVDESHPETTARVTLKLATVETEVVVGSDDEDALTRSAGSTTLNQQQLAGFAEDPDDLANELQALATAGGGVPGKAIITVNGFQNSTKLPPKASIREIRINPDMFSAEYATPPYAGGRIEAYTRAGQDSFHGTLFGYYSGASLNARDPLALSSTPAAKRRLGFSLSGPLMSHKRADFALDLEERHINENATVNATVLDDSNEPRSYNEVVGIPQQLWIGNGSSSWQFGPKDTFIASFSANTNDMENKGVGGLVLPDAGYESCVTEYDARFVNTTIVGPNLLHTTHLGFSWKGNAQSPNSFAPSLQVEGAFVSGGVSTGRWIARERDLEFDDDVQISSGRHSTKIGIQVLGAFLHNQIPDGFNGTFTFGGGNAPVLDNAGNPIPGKNEIITGLEQYRRAITGLAGGNPTTYSVTGGNPTVPMSQWTVGLYAQDQWKIDTKWSLALGLRYFAQTSPDVWGTWAPRFGIAWSPDKKHAWVFHARLGTFYDSIPSSATLQTIRLDGTRQHNLTYYSPSYNNPSAGNTPVETTRRFAPQLNLGPSIQAQLAVEHTIHKNWRLSANVYYTDHWSVLRSQNVNAPLVDGTVPSPIGLPRPGAPNLNVFEYQQSGRVAGPISYIGLTKFSKRYSIISGYLYNGLRGNADTPDTFPQSTYSDRGDYARPAWLVSHNLFTVFMAQLPFGLNSTNNLTVSSGLPFDVTTGFDNNGDGVFNDRPSITSTIGPGVYSTRYGLLTTAGIDGDLPRDRGTMPATVHLDTSLSRDFKFNPDQTGLKRKYVFRIEARSSNILNHANYKAVDGIVGTPQFGNPTTADFGRRLEFGLRATF
jgi:hypothetical protein